MCFTPFCGINTGRSYRCIPRLGSILELNENFPSTGSKVFALISKYAFPFASKSSQKATETPDFCDFATFFAFKGFSLDLNSLQGGEEVFSSALQVVLKFVANLTKMLVSTDTAWRQRSSPEVENTWMYFTPLCGINSGRSYRWFPRLGSIPVAKRNLPSTGSKDLTLI